jgi:hypothetical protein
MKTSSTATFGPRDGDGRGEADELKKKFGAMINASARDRLHRQHLTARTSSSWVCLAR